MKKYLFGTLLALLAFNATAGELDETSSQKPAGVILKVDAKTQKAEAFTVSAEMAAQATNPAALKDLTSEANKISKVTVKAGSSSELDQETSRDSWYYYNYGSYYNPYSCFRYYYYPSYSYSYSYSYSWYYRSSYYYGGYNYYYYY